MATKFVYSVLDNKANYYSLPMFVRSRAEAMRVFQEWCSDKTTQLFKHPQDFHLCELASWDECTGKFVLLDIPLQLVSAMEYFCGDNLLSHPSISDD